MKFKQFIEVLNFNAPHRTNMQRHPLVMSATVGIEVEFMTASIPFKDFDTEKLAEALQDAEEYKEWIRQKLYDNSDDPDEELSENDFYNYIKQNKLSAYKYFMSNLETGNLNFGKTNNEWKHTVTEYWAEYFIKAIVAAGFRAQEGEKAAANIWAVGDDGMDTIYNIPILEIRSSIIPANNLDNLEKALEGMADIAHKNPKEIMAMGNTGIHIHVHNSGLGKTGQDYHYDAFNRLAVATHTDENELWNSMTQHDREFERHALMNKMQDFSSRSIGAHDEIIKTLNHLRKPATKTPIIISNKELWRHLSVNYDRNKGINIVSQHPTVEYRYLTTAVLLENGGPRKIIEWIKYFVDNAASQTNKNRIQFVGNFGKVVLTRLPSDMVRIDFDENKKIPQAGLPKSMMGQTNERPPNVGFEKWWNNLMPQDQLDYMKKVRGS